MLMSNEGIEDRIDDGGPRPMVVPVGVLDLVQAQ